MAKAILQNLDGIPDVDKANYKPIEGGTGFFFDLEGVEEHPRVLALKRAKDREATEATQAKTALREATERLTLLTGEHEKLSKEFDERLRGAVGSKEEDLKLLEQRYLEKNKKTAEGFQAQISQRDAALTEILVNNQARAIVANMNPEEPEFVETILPHVIPRLAVELTPDGARTRVLGVDGKPSADSIAELTEQLKVDKRFSKLLTGSKANGGNANGGNANGNGSAGPTKIDLTKASLAEKVAHYEAQAKQAH